MSRLDAFHRGGTTHHRGRLAEDAGSRWLERQGFEILERNLRFKAGELDVVALDGETLCFVEIKARATSTCGGALDAVTVGKRRQIAAAAALYLAAHPWAGPCRFDVLAMDGDSRGWRYTLIRDAFEVG